jgi:DNA recombination-dependent growth factor C
MSALQGSLTYSRFFVDIAPPKDFRERYMRAIRLRTIQPLGTSDEDMERTGFCAIGDPFDLELNPTKVVYESFINLGVRTDRWVFPSSLVKARVREAEALYLEKKGRQRLSKTERAELKQAVQQKLKHKLTPQIRAVDLSWSMEEQLVRYFTHSAKSIASMLELFEKTFHIKLVQESPYTLAANSGSLTQREKQWEQLEPCDLREQAS